MCLQYTRSKLWAIRASLERKQQSLPLKTLHTLRSENICATPKTKRGTVGGVNHVRVIPALYNNNRDLPTVQPQAGGLGDWCSRTKQHGCNVNNLITVSCQQEKHVTCILLNAQSLCNKTLTVREHMLDYKADLMLLTETWLKPSKTAIVNELTPPGYSFIGECRTEKRGGGTGLLFKSEYKFAKMPSPRFKTFEVLDVKTTHSERPLRVIIIYRSPTSPTK